MDARPIPTEELHAVPFPYYYGSQTYKTGSRIIIGKRLLPRRRSRACRPVKGAECNGRACNGRARSRAVRTIGPDSGIAVDSQQSRIVGDRVGSYDDRLPGNDIIHTDALVVAILPQDEARSRLERLHSTRTVQQHLDGRVV